LAGLGGAVDVKWDDESKSVGPSSASQLTMSRVDQTSCEYCRPRLGKILYRQ
jgi:hypothetical protein